MEDRPLYGLCPLSIAPLRAEPSDKAELVNQVLYGEHFQILEQQKKWSLIRLGHDAYEGWIDNKQYKQIDDALLHRLNSQTPSFSQELIDMIDTPTGLLSIVPGSRLDAADLLGHRYEGQSGPVKGSREDLVDTALLFMNAPYLWGGRTPFGIDCSGFTQVVYRINGYDILRDASQQATQGEALSFIEECLPGDLAFFDNEEGAIIHVGILLADNHIVHAHGQVRIDRIDQSGIFNSDTQQHSHKLRVIKRIL